VRALAGTDGDVVVGWKDPRASLVLPFWRELVDVTASIVVVRDPVEVAASLTVRNGFTPEHGAYLWLRYVLGALDGPAVAPLVVAYRDCLEDPDAIVTAVAGHLGLRPTEAQHEAARGFVDGDLAHHDVRSRPVARDDPWTSLACDVWDAGAPRPSVVDDVLREAIRVGWVGPPSGGHPLQREIERLSEQLEHAHARNHALREQARLGREAERRRQRIDDLRAELATARSRIRHLERALEQTKAAMGQSPDSD
jgi:hypothetical protein